MVESGFGIEVLAGQSQVLSDGATDGAFAQGLIRRVPDDFLAAVSDALRRSEPVVMDESTACRRTRQLWTEP